MKFQFDDGGRAAAGYKGQTRDCVIRAITIASQRPYQHVYDELARACRESQLPKCFGKSSPGKGIAKDITKAYLRYHGWTWTPTMGIGTGCTVHLCDGELPTGRLIVSVSRHMVAVIDGVIHDTFDCSRGETRCVYGYWSKP